VLIVGGVVFHRFLYGQHFTLESEHRPREYLQSNHSRIPGLRYEVWLYSRIAILFGIHEVLKM